MKLGLMLSILIATIAMTRVCPRPPDTECIIGRKLSSVDHPIPKSCGWSGYHCYKIAYMVPDRDGSASSGITEWVVWKGCMGPPECNEIGTLNKCRYGLHHEIDVFPDVDTDRIPDTTTICCCNTTRCNSGQADLKASAPFAATLLLLIKFFVQMYY